MVGLHGYPAGAVDRSACEPLEQGRGFVAVKWREIVTVGVYFLPNRSVREFDFFLDTIGDVVSNWGSSLLVLGDLNARFHRWNVMRNARDDAFLDWADGLGLILLNRGLPPT